MANEGINRLGRVLHGRMQEVNNTPPLLDFGVIQNDYSLLTNKFPLPIPKADYLVCRQLTIGAKDEPLTATALDGQHDVFSDPYPKNDPPYKHVGIGVDHQHQVLIPEKLRWLKPGDRVLVAWVGDDACVIDLIYPASVIG